jgi:hypothetical protein
MRSQGCLAAQLGPSSEVPSLFETGLDLFHDRCSMECVKGTGG